MDRDPAIPRSYSIRQSLATAIEAEAAARPEATPSQIVREAIREWLKANAKTPQGKDTAA